MRRRPWTLVVPLIAGCHACHPAGRPSSPTGHPGRITLADAGTEDLVLRSASTGALAGRVVRDSAETYLVALLATRKRDGVAIDWKGEQVNIPRVLIARISWNW